MTSLSSTEKETASPCVPSRSVVSNVWMRIRLLAGGGLLFFGHARLFPLLQKCHHLAQFAAHALDGLVLRGGAHRQKFLASALVLVNPLARKLAGADLAQNFPHFFPRLGIDDARAARVIAVLGGGGHRESHVAEAAFVDQVDNQLQLMQ